MVHIIKDIMEIMKWMNMHKNRTGESGEDIEKNRNWDFGWYNHTGIVSHDCCLLKGR